MAKKSNESWPTFFRRLNNRLRRAGIYIHFDESPYPASNGGEFTIFRPAGVDKEEGHRNSNNPFLNKGPTMSVGSREAALDWIDDFLTDERLDIFERQMTGTSWEDDLKE